MFVCGMSVCVCVLVKKRGSNEGKKRKDENGERYADGEKDRERERWPLTHSGV